MRMNKFTYQMHKLFHTKKYQRLKEQKQTRSEDGVKIADYGEPSNRVNDRPVYTDIYKTREGRQTSYKSINFDSDSQQRRSINETENIYEDVQLKPDNPSEHIYEDVQLKPGNPSEHIYEEVQLKPKNMSEHIYGDVQLKPDNQPEHIYEDVQLKRKEQIATTITADSQKNVRKEAQKSLYSKVDYAKKKNRRNVNKDEKSTIPRRNTKQKTRREESWEKRQTI